MNFRADNWGPNPKIVQQCIEEEGPNAGCGDAGTSAYEWVSYDPSDPTSLGWFSRSNSASDWSFKWSHSRCFENQQKFSFQMRAWDMGSRQSIWPHEILISNKIFVIYSPINLLRIT